jgi:hypothetical protein
MTMVAKPRNDDLPVIFFIENLSAIEKSKRPIPEDEEPLMGSRSIMASE